MFGHWKMWVPCTNRFISISFREPLFFHSYFVHFSYIFTRIRNQNTYVWFLLFIFCVNLKVANSSRVDITQESQANSYGYLRFTTFFLLSPFSFATNLKHATNDVSILTAQKKLVVGWWSQIRTHVARPVARSSLL